MFSYLFGSGEDEEAKKAKAKAEEEERQRARAMRLPSVMEDEVPGSGRPEVEDDGEELRGGVSSGSFGASAPGNVIRPGIVPMGSDVASGSGTGLTNAGMTLKMAEHRAKKDARRMWDAMAEADKFITQDSEILGGLQAAVDGLLSKASVDDPAASRLPMNPFFYLAHRFLSATPDVEMGRVPQLRVTPEQTVRALVAWNDLRPMEGMGGEAREEEDTGVWSWSGDDTKVKVLYSGTYTDGKCWGEASVVRACDGDRLNLAVGPLLRQYCSGPVVPDNVDAFKAYMQLSVESKDYVLESFPSVRGESTWVGYALPVNPETQTPRVVHVLQVVNVRARDWEVDGGTGLPLWMGGDGKGKQRAQARLNMEGGLKAFVALVVNDCIALATGMSTALVHLCVGTKVEDETGEGGGGGGGEGDKEFVNALHGCMMLPSPRPGRPPGVLRVGPRELLMEKVAKQMAAAIKAGTIEKRRVWCEFVVATGGKAKCQFTRIVKMYQFYFTGPDGRSFSYASGPRADAVGGGGLFLSEEKARGYRELILRLPAFKGKDAQVSAQERTEETWRMAKAAMKASCARLWRRGDLMWAVSAAVKAVVHGCAVGGSLNKGDSIEDNERAASALLPYARLWQTKGAQVVLFIRELENLLDVVRGRPPVGLLKRAAVHAQGLLARMTFFFFHRSDGDRGEADIHESLGRSVVHDIRRLLPNNVGGENLLSIPPKAALLIASVIVRLRMLAMNLLEIHISKTPALRDLILDALGSDRAFPVLKDAVPSIEGMSQPMSMVPWLVEDPYGFGKPKTLLDLKAEISHVLRHRLIPMPAAKEGTIMRYLIMTGVKQKLMDLYLETLKPPIAKDPYTDIYDSLLTSATLHETVDGIGKWLPVARAIFADGSKLRTPPQWKREFAPAFAENIMSVLDASPDAHETHDQAWGRKSAISCFLPGVLTEVVPLKNDLKVPASYTKGAYLVRCVTSLEGLWGATAACGSTLFTVHFLDHLFVDGATYTTALTVCAEFIVTSICNLGKEHAGRVLNKKLVGGIALQGLQVGTKDDPGYKHRVLRLGDLESKQRECIGIVSSALVAGRPVILRAAFLCGLRSGKESSAGYMPLRKRFVVYHRSMAIDKSLERTTDVVDAACKDLPQDADIETVWTKDEVKAVATPTRFAPFESGSVRDWTELGGFRDRAGYTCVFLSAEDAELWHEWVYPEEEAAEELTSAYRDRLKLLKLSLMIRAGLTKRRERLTADKIALAWAKRAKVLLVLRQRAFQRARQESNDLAVYEYQLRQRALRFRSQGNYVGLFRMVLRAGLAMGHRDVVAECARVFQVDSVDSLLSLNKVNKMFRDFGDLHQVHSFSRALDIGVLYDQYVSYAQMLPPSLFGAKSPFFRSFATRLAVERSLAATHKALLDAKHVRRPITAADVAPLSEVHEVTRQSVNTFLALAFRGEACARMRKLVAVWTAGLSGMALPPRPGVSAEDAFNAEAEEEEEEQRQQLANAQDE